MRTNRSVRGSESGFALVLALLALLLLTFLGLTLAVTTSTELQIATNYRWSEQARYVAEAGIEAGKIMLHDTLTWENLLPTPRSDPWVGDGSPAAVPLVPRPGVRDFEGGDCDDRGQGMGYGRVLNFGNGGPGTTPQQYIGDLRQSEPVGVFTLWVRRPLHYLPSGQIIDWGGAVGPPLLPVSADADNNNLILVAEGSAPFVAAPGGSAAQQQLMGRAKATYVIEVALSEDPPILGGCDNPLSGQQGQGPGGANFGGCEKMGEGSMDVAAQGSNSSGPRTDTGVR